MSLKNLSPSAIGFLVLLASTVKAAEPTDWFHQAQCGVMTHYLGAPPSSKGGAELTAEMWNKQVDAFDVAGLVDQLASTGAKYLLITLGQNSGHYCSPNAWCQGDQPQQPDEKVIALTRQLAEKGGVVTFDVPIQKSGLIPQPFVEQLRAIGQAMARPAGSGPSKGVSKPAEPVQLKPTVANVAYGTHERQVLDFWKAESSGPTPLLFHIHGGGWVAGDKAHVDKLDKYLAAGVSVVSINYRYVTQAMVAGVKPPVQWPLHDAARALQFVRSKSNEWNIDKQRIGASGGSAGACSSLWLAFHDDMADPKSADPVARESTRLWCAAVVGAQTTLDPQQMKEWTPNSRYGGHAFGFMPDPANTKTRDTQFAQFLAARETILPWIKEYSPFALVTADDPPIYLHYSAPPALGQEQKDPTHTSNFGVKLQERLRSVGVECELIYPGAPDVKHAQVHDYLIAKLKAAQASLDGGAAKPGVASGSETAWGRIWEDNSF
jgi:acetyl esterase/lipase